MQPIVKSEFVIAHAPFSECHAPTLVETPTGLIVAFFAGSREGGADVSIWLVRQTAGGWSKPREIVTGAAGNPRRYPCWNPVLFQPSAGFLLLFYKVGPSPAKWWGMLMTSQDHGATWSEPRRLPHRIWGPVKNKPIQLDNGVVLCPTSDESRGWRVFVQTTTDFGMTWKSIGPLNDGRRLAAIQPSVLRYPSGALQLLCRSKVGWLVDCWSMDNGNSWSAMATTALPNPNSGIDAVNLHDGRALVVYNHVGTAAGGAGQRSPLNVAVSNDGLSWSAGLVLESEPGEFSYPAVIQAADGRVHVTYTWRRKNIRYVVIEPSQLVPMAMPAGEWPATGSS